MVFYAKHLCSTTNQDIAVYEYLYCIICCIYDHVKFAPRMPTISWEEMNTCECFLLKMAQYSFHKIIKMVNYHMYVYTFKDKTVKQGSSFGITIVYFWIVWLVILKRLYVPIVWTQWLLTTKSVQYVYWRHNGRGHSSTSQSLYISLHNWFLYNLHIWGHIRARNHIGFFQVKSSFLQDLHYYVLYK